MPLGQQYSVRWSRVGMNLIYMFIVQPCFVCDYEQGFHRTNCSCYDQSLVDKVEVSFHAVFNCSRTLLLYTLTKRQYRLAKSF
uniref:Putative ovule protein n=1 Tax=Solanum chacoense TaxID=4108 RepID=A0A0V0GU96_SOLCH